MTGGAELARFIDRDTIEYVRTYPHPIERVWRAVSDAGEVSIWFWAGRSEARLGGAYVFGPEDGPFKFAGVITAFEPPRLIRYGGPHPGPESYWQFELTPAQGGTRMAFVQRITPGRWVNVHDWPADPPEHPAGEANPWRPGTLSGWHWALDGLGVLMDGGRWSGPTRSEQARLDQRYREHMLSTQP
jgi:uncharacterized protein YndB with AHSA1/START domain